MDIEREVLRRYGAASAAREDSLCCPVTYDARYLDAIADEIRERDYGCGDPSRYVSEGDTVLDLGSGGGKLCYIASQIVGPAGRVIGVDFNPEMLALARKHQREIAGRIGWDNVTFVRARIQDLRTDLDALERILARQPITSWAEYQAFEERRRAQARSAPLIGDESVDVVLSSCVLNLVPAAERRALFSEIYRVLRRGGRAAISDIVADEPVPDALRDDPELWTGCISGAFQEREFLRAFEEAGFYGIEIADRDQAPWRTVAGIEFRSMTLVARKGKDGPCRERNQAVIYKGPWREVRDDDGHVFERGVPSAVCDKTFRIMTRAPYRAHVIAVEPRTEVPPEDAGPFDCTRPRVREPRETKGAGYDATTEALACGPGSGCCG